MATHIEGKAVFKVDFMVEEDLTEEEAEQRFNDAVQSLFDYGNVLGVDGDNSDVDYTQDHTYGVEEDDA